MGKCCSRRMERLCSGNCSLTSYLHYRLLTCIFFLTLCAFIHLTLFNPLLTTLPINLGITYYKWDTYSNEFGLQQIYKCKMSTNSFLMD